MTLTNKQEIGLKIALDKYKAHDKFVVISGYAGSGKTTLVKFIIDALDVNEDKVAYATYTGKAAEVLRKKGNKNAMTLHRLLYDSFPRPGGGFVRVPKKVLEYTIVVIDEVSMVPKTMIDMLLAHKVFVVFLGDPGQLPQIDKNESHTLLDKPDIFLDEIMRQAQESEIIRLTMKIRAGEEISFTEGKEVIVAPKKDFVTGHMLWADTILCATNNTRHNLNNQMRQLLGYSGVLPCENEKLICLHNYWEDLSDDGESVLVNGIVGTITNPFETFRQAPSYIKMKNHKIPLIHCEFHSEDGHTFSNVDMDKNFIFSEIPFLDWRESYALGRLKPRIGDIAPRIFTFGYAMTVHKAQGSQWPNVLVVEENFPFDKEEHKKWLYTACTRSEQKLVLIKN